MKNTIIFPCLSLNIAINAQNKLDLSNKQLDSIPVEIWKLTNLTELNLSNNNLRSLPVEIGKLINLTWLDLSNNKLDSLPSEIDMLTSLKTVRFKK